MSTSSNNERKKCLPGVWLNLKNSYLILIFKASFKNPYIFNIP